MLLAATSLILSLLFLGISYCFGKKNPGKSSLFTAGSMIVLLAAPLFYFIPKVEVEWAFMQVSHATANEAAFSWPRLLTYLWALGSAILLLRLLSHYISVRSWRKHAKRCTTPQWTHRLHECCSQLNMDTIPSLALCSEISSPVVTGLVYPQILLPSSSKEWSEDTINHVLLHELGHVKRRDLWISIASHLACAIYWFNPLVWLLRKQQATQCEFACDTFVLLSGANPKNYIHAICDVAESASNQSHITLALAMADKASLRQRVELLLQEQGPSNRLVSIAILTLTAGSALAINVIRPTLPPSPETNDILQKEVNIRLEANPFPESK